MKRVLLFFVFFSVYYTKEGD